MVEAGLGIAIVPLLQSGIVTRACRVAIRPIEDPIRPIHSGILTRKDDNLSAAARAFVGFIQGIGAAGGGRKRKPAANG
jgi:DNA-binding transcriptional LysR family regulator